MNHNGAPYHSNLVTGATGIVEADVLLYLLQRGLPVTACRQKNSDLSKVERLFTYYDPANKDLFEQIKWIELDIRDVFSLEEAFGGIDHVYHCAGFVSFNKKDRKKLFEINEKGTRNVVDTCITSKVKALCHVSSIGAINNTDHRPPLNENVFWKTSGKESDYALSKYNAEREVWRGMEEGLNAVIVNPGVILAPGFWDQSSSRIFSNCFKGNIFYTEGTTAYVAATDVAEMMVKLVEKKLFRNRYILIENNYVFRQVFNTIHDSLKKRRPFIKATRLVLNTGRIAESFVSALTGKEQMITRSLINSALNKQTFTNGKVTNALQTGFRPVVPLIGEICLHYLSELQKPK